jgi:hypothetical protein
MIVVAWRKHVMGSSGDAAMEGKMAGVVCGGTRDGLEEGGKRGSDCSTWGLQSLLADNSSPFSWAASRAALGLHMRMDDGL